MFAERFTERIFEKLTGDRKEAFEMHFDNLYIVCLILHHIQHKLSHWSNHLSKTHSVCLARPRHTVRTVPYFTIVRNFQGTL